MLPLLGREGWHAWTFYLVGILAYIFLDALVHRPMWFYVFGHELTHALSALLSGAKVHSFKASSKGGEVRLSKSNVFVALSPYILPIYTGFVVALYAILRHWWPGQTLTQGFQFFMGFSVAFHLALTFHAVHLRQPDLKVVGIFLSVVLIAVGNFLILGFLGVSLFKKTPTTKQYLSNIGHETVIVWEKGITLVKNKWIR